MWLYLLDFADGYLDREILKIFSICFGKSKISLILELVLAYSFFFLKSFTPIYPIDNYFWVLQALSSKGQLSLERFPDCLLPCPVWTWRPGRHHRSPGGCSIHSQQVKALSSRTWHPWPRSVLEFRIFIFSKGTSAYLQHILQCPQFETRHAFFHGEI